MSEASLIQRLKERKIVQWAITYLAGAWVVFEVADAVGGRWNLPDVLFQGLAVVLSVGFCITLVLAWYHGEKGRQRVSGPELLMVTALLIVAGVALSTLGPDERAPSSDEAVASGVEGDGRARIAVLPCDNLSTDPADEYLAASLHDEILLRLQRISSLFSIGRASVEWYRNHPAPLTQVAQELGVGFVGACSVQKYEDQIRLIFQLLDGRTGAQVWADDYDRDLTIGSLFDIQSEIAQRIARAIGAELTSEDQARIATRPTDDLEAYELYLLGRHHWNQFTEEGIRRSIEHYQEAIATDSRYAPAYVGLADAYLSLGLGHGQGAADPLEVMPRAKEAVGTALKLDPNSAEALAVLGMITFTFDFGYAEAERLLLRAIEQNPNSALAHDRYAILLTTVGRHEEAIEANGRARALDPLQLILAVDRGNILRHAGRVGDALTVAMEVQRLAPQAPISHRVTGQAYLATGQYADAILSFRRALELSDGDPWLSAGLGHALARSGDEAAAREILVDLFALAEHRYVNPVEIGYLHLGLGEDEGALTWFERAVDGHAGWVNHLQYRPGIERLRSHPRFQELLRRMNLVD